MALQQLMWNSLQALHLGHDQPMCVFFPGLTCDLSLLLSPSLAKTLTCGAGIVFRSWRVTGLGSLIFSLLAVIALSAGYEAIKEAARRYELRTASTTDPSSSRKYPDTSFRPVTMKSRTPLERVYPKTQMRINAHGNFLPETKSRPA